jgi:hypothetical protein
MKPNAKVPKESISATVSELLEKNAEGKISAAAVP